ncbi:MAG TPA: tRNA pseudouridine(38-40) synthase TruA [Vicinamibacterales bacterium]|nr:tRNA pseudouridine(38-40) synthase TruA [Vicinamibacterales bacterium]
MLTFKLLLAYDGTDLVGWQRQPEGVSVQGLLEDALAPFQAEPVSVVGAGRTDAGVHATGQVASTHLMSPAVGAGELQRALNARLPPTVRVIGAEDAPPSFHARFDARTKTYEYRILNGPVVSPFVHRYAWHVPWPLDVDRMAQAARAIEGTHDFACFQSTGSDVATSVRQVFESRVVLAPSAPAPAVVPDAVIEGDRLIVYRITGTGFLRHMVRAIVGTLVEIGRGSADPRLVSRLLEGGVRAAAGPTAPARGLCLAAVSYADPPAAVAAHR